MSSTGATASLQSVPELYTALAKEVAALNASVRDLGEAHGKLLRHREIAVTPYTAAIHSVVSRAQGSVVLQGQGQEQGQEQAKA
mmetsp:Transcript_6139/g.10909  ORF Transcript_6139/g.10909 Transcript_6139/m.10909 type:complete len:84 (+) Transcript_6139:26-277(+)